MTHEARSEIPTRFMRYFDLRDAFGKPGCPVCRLLEEGSRRNLDNLLYERVNDPGTRDVLRASRGFCNWHAWMLREILHSASGVSILYSDFLVETIRSLKRLAEQPPAASPLRRLWARLGGPRGPAPLRVRERRPPCPACHGWPSEAHDLQTLVAFLEDSEFGAAYERSDGLCLPHLERALSLASPATAIRLLEITVPRLEHLKWELEEFGRKRDYRYAGEERGEEGTAWLRAIEFFVGKPQVFGNDRGGLLPAAAETPAPSPATCPVPADEAERLQFELARARQRLQEVTRAWTEESSRAAALHYQVTQLREEKRRLEFIVAGLRGGDQAWNSLAEHLREQVQALQQRIVELEGRTEVQPGAADGG